MIWLNQTLSLSRAIGCTRLSIIFRRGAFLRESHRSDDIGRVILVYADWRLFLCIENVFVFLAVIRMAMVSGMVHALLLNCQNISIIRALIKCLTMELRSSWWHEIVASITISHLFHRVYDTFYSNVWMHMYIYTGVHAIIPLSAIRYEFMNDTGDCELDLNQTYSRVWCFEVELLMITHHLF